MLPSTIAKISIDNLNSEHIDSFQRTLSTILSSPLAELTYSQIIDGLPIRDVWNAYTWPRLDIENHVSVCDDSVEILKAFRNSFQIHTLAFDGKLLQAYQNSTPDSPAFTLRLLEMIAVACHDIGAFLYTKAKSDKHELERQGFIRNAPVVRDPSGNPYPPKPTDFFRPEYQDLDQYPQGVADMVGYWAEFEIFGGAVLFDRGEEETDCKAAFIHPGRNYQIFQLSQTQLHQFARLSSASFDSSTELSLPFKAEKYARRLDEADSMSLHIFRDKWERKPLITNFERVQHPRRRLEDDPEMMDVMQRLKEGKSALP